jgi:mxaJ protein
MRRSTLTGTLLVALTLLSSAGQARELKVCADPNNLPFSNRQQQGFENKLATLIAGELHAQLTYVWWAQRRGNVRETLKAGRCDLIPGVASNLEMLATTRPYYRSTYVFVTRASDRLELSGFDDPRLRTLTVGVQMIGDDFSNTPPAHALARRGVVDNVAGGQLDVAVVWGPLAGYFSRQRRPELHLQPVSPLIDGPMLPMVFDISMGVREHDRALRRELNEVLTRRAPQIRALLDEYSVPVVTTDQVAVPGHR